jgi:hypothetical protein
VVDVVAASINIMQIQITRSRLAGEPADVATTPRISHCWIFIAQTTLSRKESAPRSGL